MNTDETKKLNDTAVEEASGGSAGLPDTKARVTDLLDKTVVLSTGGHKPRKPGPHGPNDP